MEHESQRISRESLVRTFPLQSPKGTEWRELFALPHHWDSPKEEDWDRWGWTMVLSGDFNLFGAWIILPRK